MPEKEEKKDNIKQHEQKEIKKEEKPSLWQKIKKPLVAGILAAGLFMSPAKRVEGAAIQAIRAPPSAEYSSTYIEKRWKTGWKILLKGWDESVPGNQREIFYKASLNYFKNAYEKAKEKGIKHEIISAYYLYTWQTYALAGLEWTIKDTENKMLEALEMVEKRLKEAPDDYDFVDLKLMIYYNLAEMYAGVALNDSLEAARLNIRYGMGDMTKEECKEKAIYYGKKFLEFYNEDNIKNSKVYSFLDKPDVLAYEGIRMFVNNYNLKKKKIEIYLKELNPE